MSNVSMVKSINCFSEKLKQAGPAKLFQYLIELGAKFKKYGGAPNEYIDPIKTYVENPKRMQYKFEFQNYDYSLTFSIELGHLLMFGDVDFVDTRRNELSAENLLKITETIIPKFSFIYGYFDLEGMDQLSEKTIHSMKLTTIFWANFFGKPYIEKYGKDFLLNAPGWKKVELPDQTVEYVLTENPFLSMNALLEKNIVEYFSPKAKIKRYKPSSID